MVDGVRIKVCGFTCREDVAAAVSAGVDAFGFNFAAGPRRIEPSQAAAIAAPLSPFHVRVALFVDADAATIDAAMRASACQVVQLHGDEAPELAEELRRRYPVIKAVRVRDRETLSAMVDYPADALLLDAYVPGVAGGTGQQWQHQWLAEVALPQHVVVAGGITPANVASILARVPQAIGVDTASGVESQPGRKDPALLQALVHAVRSGGGHA